MSHDRYFVERLATKIVEIGHGGAVVFPGTYTEFLWSKAQKDLPVDGKRDRPERGAGGKRVEDASAAAQRAKAEPRGASKTEDPATDHAERKRQAAEQRKRDQAAKNARARISELETRIAEREQAMKEIEAAMSSPGFYEKRDQAQP